MIVDLISDYKAISFWRKFLLILTISLTTKYKIKKNTKLNLMSYFFAKLNTIMAVLYSLVKNTFF